VILISEIEPLERIAKAFAEVEAIPIKEISGEEEYPEPPSITVIVPIIPSPIVATAWAPAPDPPVNETVGATV
jgi:hypothetical protein